LCNKILGQFAGNLGGQIENLVYLELRRLGYEVFVGRLGDKEVDFVIVKNGIIKYTQVALVIHLMWVGTISNSRIFIQDS
jgi:predicted AAA+ superfamily ATPase